MNHFHRYGQVVVGPCGSGKTTYCDGMQQYLQLLGRTAVVINFDPANHTIDAVSTETRTATTNTNTALPYTAIYDVCTEAVNVQSVMQQMKLGPNGALIYCMEYIEEHADEIIDTILSRCCSTDPTNPNSNSSSSNNNNYYYIFDFPGQIELYTYSTCVQSVLHKLTTQFHMKLTVVQLMDALYCTDATKFISATLLGTTTMIRLELPTVNVLSKVDLLSSYGTLPFQLDYYTECYDLQRLIPFLHPTNVPSNDDASMDPIADNDEEDEYDIADDPEYQIILQQRRTSKFAKSYERLHRALAEVVEDFSLLSWIPLDITNAESVGRVLANIDRCNGYIYTTSTTTTISSSSSHPPTRTVPTTTTTTTTTTTRAHEDLFQCAVRQDGSGQYSQYESLADIRERMGSPESIRALRRKQ